MFGRFRQTNRSGSPDRSRDTGRHGSEAEQAGPAGAPPAAAVLLSLQRRVGNAAVGSLLAEEKADTGAARREAVDGVLRSSGKPLEPGVRADFESTMGTTFADVRVHHDAAADDSAAALDAEAYTSGSHIAFRRGMYDPGSASGRRRLAHELTHVIQQRSGPVAGTDDGRGLRVSHREDPFERAAEANAERVAREPAALQRTTARTTAPGSPPGSPPGRAPGGLAVQRVLTNNTTRNRVERGSRLETPAGPSAPRQRVAAAWMLTDGTLQGTAPLADPAGFDYIRQLHLTSFWIRFHLVNETAGGLGTLNNLVPASKRDNSRYETQIEAALKADVAQAKANPGDLVFFGVEVTYGTPSQGSQRQRDASHNFPTSLTVYHEYYDAVAQAWTVRHNGTVFTFTDAQPADPGVSAQISTLTLPTLKSLVPQYHNWDAADLAFLNALGGARRAPFERLIDQNSGLGPVHSVEAAFQTLPFAEPRPNPRSAAQAAQQGVTLATRIGDPAVILALSRLIAHGNITL